MAFQESRVRDMVRRVVLRTLGTEGNAVLPANSGKTPSLQSAYASPLSIKERQLVTEKDVLTIPPGGELRLSSEAIITPLAREAARQRQVSLVSESAVVVAESATPGSKTVAIGADHSSYALKDVLKAQLQEWGYRVLDCGTHGPEAVDYPDFAYAVARLVSEGQAWRGIVVDGAGIGSCMAANKVPGVRAAMCYDLSTAVNSREHNDANVLTLGGRLIGDVLAREIVNTWLNTDFGGGRHARRVGKIVDIERRFLKRQDRA